MSIKNHSRYFFSFAIIAFLIFSPCAWADSRSDVSAMLVVEGKEYFSQGEYFDATHAFTKALLLDPNNTEAKYYYDLCSALFYTQQKDRLGQTSPAADEMNQLSEASKSHLPSPKITVTAQTSEQLPADKIQLENIKAELLAKNQDFTQAKARLNEVVDLLAEKNLLVAQKEQDLTAVDQQLKKMEQDLTATKADGENTRLAYEKEKADLNQVIAAKENEARELRQKIDEARKDAQMQSALDKAVTEGMKTAFREKADEIASLKKDLANLNEKLAAQTALAQEKETQNTALQAQLSENKKKLDELAAKAAVNDDSTQEGSSQLAKLKADLVGKIKLINEKDRRIKEIEQQLAGLTQSTKEWGKKKTVYEEQITKLETMVTRYKKQGAVADGHNDKLIEELQDILFKNRVELGYLTNKMLYLEYELSASHALLIERNNKIVELIGQINKLEKKITQVQAKAVAKTQNPQALRNQPEKDAVIQRQEKLIAELQERLNKLSVRLQETTLSLEQKNKGYESLNNQMKEADQRLDSVGGIFPVGESLDETQKN